MCTISFSDVTKDDKNYNLPRQTGSQSKQVPPTFKATNSCPPPPSCSIERSCWAQALPAAACRSALQVLKAGQLSTGTSKIPVKPHAQGEPEKGKRTGQRDPQGSPSALMHLREDPILSSDFTPGNATYTASRG